MSNGNDNDNITLLNERRAQMAEDNRLWTAEQCLEAVLRDVRAGIMPGKVIVLMIDTGSEEEPTFDVPYYAAQMRASEILAALEIVKLKVLDSMGYP